MTTRVDRIIDLIDGALDDDTLDAMRWTPESVPEDDSAFVASATFSFYECSCVELVPSAHDEAAIRAFCEQQYEDDPPTRLRSFIFVGGPPSPATTTTPPPPR